MPYPDPRPLKSRARRYVLSHARSVICNSRFTERLVRDIAPAARTVVINPAVDAWRFQPDMNRQDARQRLGLPSDRRIVLSVSRLDPVKGHETVFRAIAGLTTAERAELLYLIVGRGEHRLVLDALAESLGIANVVQFAGFVADEELPAYYAASDLFVLCSVMNRVAQSVEGFGMVCAEAQAAGIPVVGTNSGGIADAVVEGRGGWLIAERDAEALSDYLRALCRDVRPFREQGERGRARVEAELSWAAYVDRVIEVV